MCLVLDARSPRIDRQTRDSACATPVWRSVVWCGVVWHSGMCPQKNKWTCAGNGRLAVNPNSSVATTVTGSVSVQGTYGASLLASGCNAVERVPLPRANCHNATARPAECRHPVTWSTTMSPVRVATGSTATSAELKSGPALMMYHCPAATALCCAPVAAIWARTSSRKVTPVVGLSGPMNLSPSEGVQ